MKPACIASDMLSEYFNYIFSWNCFRNLKSVLREYRKIK